MSSATPSEETVQDIQVRLKPMFGVSPKTYLAVIYTLVLLAVLFLVLVLPGIEHPGTRVTVTSVPSGAAVTYGGKHWGTTPVTAFLPEGKAPLTVSKPGFKAQSNDYVSGNSLFFSLVLPRTDSVAVKLVAESEDSVEAIARADIGRWALAAPFTSTYRFPPLFTRFAGDARAAGWDSDSVRAFLLTLRSSVADPQMYLDYGRAMGLWTETVPEGMEQQFALWAPLIGGPSDRLALWLLANQTKPVRDREVAEPSDWWKARMMGFQNTLKAGLTPTFGAVPAALRSSLGSFRGVAGASFLWGSMGTSFPLPTEPPFTLPVPISTSAFWLADAEVSQAQFAVFTAAHPEWAPEGRDALQATGKADDGYLSSWSDGKPSAPAEPVASVSWYAAQAYVDWVNASGLVPAGKKAVLPDDFQWEAAARAASGASLLNQGVWEWTSSSYYPGQSLIWDTAAPAEKEAWARSLKGGVQNAKGSVRPGDRAGWPASGTSTGLGFRLALVSP